jgi:hypothetical protein
LDTIQEISVQPNTYSVERGSASSIQVQVTTKSGTDKYHGTASEYYQYQKLNARGEYGTPHPEPVDKYHTNNLSFALGGPVPRVKQLFFFVSYNPYHTITPTNTSTYLETDPSFISQYMENSGSPSLEVQTMLQPYNLPTSQFTVLNQNNPANYQTAAQAFNGGICPTSGNLGPEELNVPCTAVVNQYGLFNATGYTNAMQYSFRVDKVFSKDRIYVSLFRSTLNDDSWWGVLPSLQTRDNMYEYALQANETHTFSANFLNEAIVGFTRVEANFTEGNYYYNPTFSISGLATSYGKGEYQDGDYALWTQKYRDTLTYIRRGHSFSLGAEALYTHQAEWFASCLGIPDYSFYNIQDAAINQPDYEGGLSYNFATGAPLAFQSGFQTTTFGLFAEDAWKATRRLTLNYGIRYDNFGNPSPVTVHGPVTTKTILTTISLPQGPLSFQQQITNAAFVQSGNIYAHDQNWNFGPRAGLAYDLRGNGKWVVRGGFGVYSDWFNLGNTTNGATLNLPNDYAPNFYRGITATAPLFSVGTSGDQTYPFGYTYPTIPGSTLDAKGGIVGSYAFMSGVARNLKSSTTMNWSLGVEHQILANLTASLGYSGSHSYNLNYGGQSPGVDDIGVDVNRIDGDTIAHPIFNSNGTWYEGHQTRPNTSFGWINYAFNGARANYAALTAGVKGRFAKYGFVNASYTRAAAKDDWETQESGYQRDGSWNTNRQYGPSNLDVANRVSAAAGYNLPGLNHGNGLLRRVVSGYQLSSSVRLQTGQPFTVYAGGSLNLIDTVPGTQLTSANYQSELAAGNVTYISPANYGSVNVQTALASGNLASSAISGDYSGDGDNYATPDVLSYKQVHGRSAYKYKCPVSQSGCTGSIQASQFAAPAFNAAGTEGNEKFNQFRNPGYGDFDFSLTKATKITGRVNIQLRLDAFNAFNRVNWGGLDGNLADYNTTFGTTGTSTSLSPNSSSSNPRYGQLGVKITF